MTHYPIGRIKIALITTPQKTKTVLSCIVCAKGKILGNKPKNYLKTYQAISLSNPPKTTVY